MVQYDKYVLNKLLDTYEASLLSTGENRRTVHIEFRLLKTTLPAYFDESSQEYEKIHGAMADLENRDLVQILWKGKKTGHIISKVRLNTEMLDAAYEYVSRISKNDWIICNQQMLVSYVKQDPTMVCRTFVEYLLKRLGEHKSVKEFIQLENPEQTRQLLDVIQAIEKNDKPLYIREFSIIYFQDSKAFEDIKAKVAHVFRRFKEGSKTLKDEDLFAEYGIYHTPNYVYFKGDAVLSIGEETVDLSVLKQGIGISGEDIGRIRFCDMTMVKKIVTIENLTTYFRWQEEHSLLIYLGGYHNSIRSTLLQEIYSRYPEAEYYHFGDIDAGGFEIYRNLCEKTGIPFQMYKMDLKILQQYEIYCKPLTKNDRKRLQDMLNREELKEVISYMLEHNIKLEQECVGWNFQ